MNPVPTKAAPATRDGSIGLIDFAVIVAQLLLVLLLLRQYQVENSAGFLLVAQIAFAGFVIHAWLPLSYRLPFFALLSLAATAILLGPVNFAWMFGIGAFLIGICHLPVSFRIRGTLLVLVAGVLAAQRAGALPQPWSDAIWPILGSMFMFRLIVYFYDLRHDNAPATPARTFAYFFMLPNASFPLFPVVDYKTFRRNYYDDDTVRIYQTGIDWMLRGIIHLILYRIVYYHLTLTPAEVTTPALFLQHLASNFLLYLKVSGLFHLIVGMLYMFGFHLPETQNRYFLAAGITDYWRRINIYWKDFMQKVFYYPALFRLKKLGANTAIILATLWVFFVTWFLHAYQWFWIRGTFLLILQDILFWAILGVMLVANSLWEIKHGRKRSLGTAKFSWRSVGVMTLKAYGTFWMFCVLWSFWNADSLKEWFVLWHALGGEYTLSVLVWPVVSMIVIFVGYIPATKLETAKDPRKDGYGWIRDRALTAGVMVVLISISVESVSTRFGPEFSTAMHTLRSGTLSRIDTAKMERGYYENLTDVSRFNSQLWEVYAKKPRDWMDVENAGLKRFVTGFAQNELIPSFVSSTKYGTVTINRWGMRDQDYAEKPAPDTYRVALLGSSSLMGWGVTDGATFEALLENRLNRELAGKPFAKYELLNYGVPGYQPPQQLPNFDRAMVLHPTAVMYFATGREQSRSTFYLAEVVQKGIDIPYGPLRDIVAKAGVAKGMTEAEARQRLASYGNEILTYVYAQIGERARKSGMRAIWVFLPPDIQGAWQQEAADAERIAENAGFVVLNLEDVFKGMDGSKLILAEWDHHPNARGHEVIADRLFEGMLANSNRIFSVPSPQAAVVDPSVKPLETKQ